MSVNDYMAVFAPLNTVLNVLMFLWLLFIERRLAFLTPLKELSVQEDINRIKRQQTITDQELEKIRARVEETVQAMASLDVMQLKRKNN